jgi:hypothetical protein
MEETKTDNTTPNGEKAEEDFVSLLLAWYSRQRKSAKKNPK